MIIDFHAHIYPEKIAAKAVANICAFYNIPMGCTGTVEGLLAFKNQGGGSLPLGPQAARHTPPQTAQTPEPRPACCPTPSAGGPPPRNAPPWQGIDRFVVFSAAAAPGQVSSINDFIARTVGEHPELTGFGTLHPDFEDPAAEIERLTSLGLQGLKFHPDMQKFNIDDERMMKIYALAEGRLPIVFHTGDYRYEYSHPARLARVLKNFPRLQAVAAHFGGWSLFDLALEHLKDQFCYFDVSSSIPYLGKKRAAELIRIYGAERFLFGSDYPMWDPRRCLEDFYALDLHDDEQELILHQNATRILHMDTHTDTHTGHAAC
ncbi:MAG: amidohydrolase family protein [Treponema sp.]|jgi:predicted TIM-barrel fold metal-dependent hydrolase|nr:amidohydrolase family protein [Treponema sp.]